MAANAALPAGGVQSRFGVFFRRNFAGYLFVLPQIAFISIFILIPIIGAFYYSITNYNLLTPPSIAEPLWKNFASLTTDDRYPGSIVNTLSFAFLTVPLGVVTSLLLAVLINRAIRGIYFFRAMFYMPVVSSFVAVSLIWLWFYEPQFGLFNDFFAWIGLPTSKWLKGRDTALFAIVLMSVWKNMGLNMVIYLAGLQGIPPTIIEAADIDGAGRVSKFTRILVPLLAPTTYFVVIVYFIGALQMFVQVWIMTQQAGNGVLTGGPLNSTSTVVLLIYSNAFEYLKMGYAAAMSVVLFLVIAIITYVNSRLLKYEVGW